MSIVSVSAPITDDGNSVNMPIVLN